MARPSRSLGPFGDPRLVERRGDLRGPSAVLLVLLMVGGIGAMGALLVGVGRLVPSPAPTIQPSPAAGTSTPSFHAPASAVPAASMTPAPSASPVAVVDPGAILAAVGDSVPLTEAGEPLGTVTLMSAAYRTRIQGNDPPSESRWLRVYVTFQATAKMTVDPTRWAAVDARNQRHDWVGATAPDPPLEGISLDPGESRSGYLVIAVPASTDTRSVVLQDAAGRDIIVFAIR